MCNLWFVLAIAATGTPFANMLTRIDFDPSMDE